MYNASISLDEQADGLQQGMAVVAKVFLKEADQALVVPRTAVVFKDKKHWVYTKNGKRQVSGFNINAFDFKVTDGLKEGESVNALYPGDKS